MAFSLFLTLFLVSFIVYWYVQLATGFFSIRYPIQTGWLLLNGLIGFACIYAGGAVGQTGGGQVILVLVAVLALISFGLGLAKLLIKLGDRRRDLHDLLRSQAILNAPNERVRLRTEDGVSVQGIHIRTNHDKIIVVCHGAARNKDILSLVMLDELLARYYDVFTFDFRGHQESGGYFTGDGAAKYDLKAAIDYVRHKGYQKVGVFGWSFGAFTAIGEVAEFHNCDSLIAAASPPGELREAAMGRIFFKIGFRPWVWPIRAGLTVIRALRFKKYDYNFSTRDVVAKISPIPLFMVYNEYDTAIGMPRKRFEEFFSLAGDPKKLMILPERGHILDWPNMFDLFAAVLSWYGETL